jgi:glycosyl transferase, family 25
MTSFPQGVDLVIYINLDKRTDRRRDMEAEFKRIGVPEEKVLRWSAIENSNGALGCSMSHLAVQQYIQTLPDAIQTIIIFEDDFVFCDDVELVNSSLEKFLTYPRDIWDLALLGYAVHRRADYDDLVSLAFESYMCSGYMINRRAAPKVLSNFQQSCNGLATTGASPYLLDNYWHGLMRDRRCFYFNKALGTQRYSYSDIAYVMIARPSRVV